ncbi:MAG: heme-binding protein [Gemmatimonadetes bacterium]|nr:heme-binding protein [Gemmatimonadota bacterium]
MMNMMKATSILRAGGILGLAALCTLAAADGWAQGAAAARLEAVTLSGAAAERALTKAQINAATARAIVDACVEFARANKSSYSIFVLAPTGETLEAHVMDGQLPIGVETAQLKAKTALYARTPSSAVAQRFSTVDGRLIRLDLGQERGLAYYFVGGGLPIVVEGQLIGSIGVGGGNMDEQCAYQALTKVLGPQPPLPEAQPAGGGRGGRGGQPQ